MRLFISADMEGVAGVVTREQLAPGGFEYEAARRWMTAEVVSVCNAALAVGASEVLVADSHGTGQNILPDQLPDDVKLVRAWPRPLGMMQGVDTPGISGAVLLGYHVGAHSKAGGYAHTWSLSIRELRLNAIVASETALSAAIAGHYNVPVVLASGDDVYVRHAKELLGDIETVVTQESHSYLSSSTVTPAVSRRVLAAATEHAMTRMQDFEPFVIETPVHVEIDLVNPVMAETLGFLPHIERTGAQAVSFMAADMQEVSEFFAFFQNIESGAWGRIR